jgi:hypothetical protein
VLLSLVRSTHCVPALATNLPAERRASQAAARGTIRHDPRRAAPAKCSGTRNTRHRVTPGRRAVIVSFWHPTSASSSPWEGRGSGTRAPRRAHAGVIASEGSGPMHPRASRPLSRQRPSREPCRPPQDSLLHPSGGPAVYGHSAVRYFLAVSVAFANPPVGVAVSVSVPPLTP